MDEATTTTTLVLDLTSDVGVPVIGAVSVSAQRNNHESDRILLGFGCHTDLSKAATRAVTEVIQVQAALPSEIRGSDLPERPTGSEAIDWFAFQTLEQNQFLLPKTKVISTQYDSARCRNVGDLVNAIKATGTDVYFLNATRKDIGLPVVRCIAPGLRPWWRRLAPGRLYDIPVKMGWVQNALSEEEMNPIGMFF